MPYATRFLLLSALVAACAQQKAAPPPTVDTPAPAHSQSDEQKCQAAATLRDDGFKALNELRLSAAKRAYMKSLELDPGNRGALTQLDVIEALAEDRQIGSSHANDNVYGGVNRSPCEKYASAQMPFKPAQSAKVMKPIVAQQGQVVTFAKGTVKPEELLTQGEVEHVFKRAIDKMQSCYQKAVDQNPTLRGDLTLEISVDPQGRVSDVKLGNNTLYESAVEQCVATIAGKTAFPRRKSKQDMSVIFPLTFGPADDVVIAGSESDHQGRAVR
jgi:hypothetical protein